MTRSHYLCNQHLNLQVQLMKYPFTAHKNWFQWIEHVLKHVTRHPRQVDFLFQASQGFHLISQEEMMMMMTTIINDHLQSKPCSQQDIELVFLPSQTIIQWTVLTFNQPFSWDCSPETRLSPLEKWYQCSLFRVGQSSVWISVEWREKSFRPSIINDCWEQTQCWETDDNRCCYHENASVNTRHTLI